MALETSAFPPHAFIKSHDKSGSGDPKKHLFHFAGGGLLAECRLQQRLQQAETKEPLGFSLHLLS